MQSFSSVSLSSPTSAWKPVKPSDNSGADRLARNTEGARGEEGKFDSFFKWHKIPPTVSPSLWLFPPTTEVYLQSPTLFSTARASHIWKKPHQADSHGALTEDGMDSVPWCYGIRQPVIVPLHFQSFPFFVLFFLPPVPATTVFGCREGNNKLVACNQHVRWIYWFLVIVDRTRKEVSLLEWLPSDMLMPERLLLLWELKLQLMVLLWANHRSLCLPHPDMQIWDDVRDE